MSNKYATTLPKTLWVDEKFNVHIADDDWNLKRYRSEDALIEMLEGMKVKDTPISSYRLTDAHNAAIDAAIEKVRGM